MPFIERLVGGKGVLQIYEGERPVPVVIAGLDLEDYAVLGEAIAKPFDADPLLRRSKATH